MFLIQQVIYAGQFVRIALALPLTFCLQSDEVIAMRSKRMRNVLIIEVLIAILLVLALTIKIWSKDHTPSHIVWFVMTAGIAITLGLALRRLHSY